MSQSSRKRLIWSFLGQKRKTMSAEARRHMIIRRTRLNRRILGFVLGVSLIIGISASALFLRLTTGPLDLNFAESFVRPSLQRLLEQNARADFAKLQLEWDRSRLRLRTTDFSVMRESGELIVQAPSAYISFSVFSLLIGHIDPSAIEVVRPVLALTIQGDGSVRLGGQPPKDGNTENIPVLGLLDPQFLTSLVPNSEQTLSRGELSFLRFENVTITVSDERWNTLRKFDPFTVDLQRNSSESLDVNISAPDRHGGWSVDIAIGNTENGARDVSLETKRFNLASMMPDVKDVNVSETPIHARLSTRLGDRGLITPLAGEIKFQAGHIDGEDFAIDFEPLVLKAQLETDARTINVQPTDFRFSGIEGKFSGRLLLPAPEDPTRPVRMNFSAENLSFENGVHYPEVNRVSVAGAYELSNRTLWIDRLDAGIPDSAPVFEMRGTARFIGNTPELKLTADVAAVSVAAAKSLWPSVTAPPVRKWVRENVEGGKIEKGSIEVAIPSGWLDKDHHLLRQFVRTQWNIKEASMKLKPDLPPITGVSARVDATGTSARVEAQGGSMVLPEGKIDIPNGIFVAEELSQKNPYGRLNLVMVGAMPVLAQLAEKNNLTEEQKAQQSSGFQLTRLSGDGLANAEIRVPLWRDAKMSDATVTIDAEFKNVAGENVVEERDLKNGNFQVKIENGALSAEGSALIDEIPFKIFMNRDAANRMTLRAEAEADEALRKKLGLDLAPWITGTTLLRIVEDFSSDTPQRIEVDLTASKLSIPQLLFTKPAGQQALLSFIPKGTPRINELEDVYLRGKNMNVRGRIHLNETGEANLIEFSDIRLRPDDNFSAHIERSKGNTKAQITGRSIDMRPFLSQFFASNSSGGSSETLDLDLRVDKAIGANNESVSSLRLSMQNTGGALKSFNLSASFGQNATLLGQVSSDRGRPYIMISANDGGSLLRFLDIYSKVGGGQLTMTQTLVGPGQAAEGVVMIDNFRIVNEPAMQRLFGAAPQSQGGPKSIDNNPVFDRLRVAFTRSEGAIQVREGVLRNTSIGITFRGLLNFKGNAIDLQGSFIPMYALNNLMARIPVVGLFMGGSNEGLLGVTFAVAGPLSNPVLRINPVSAIAPGFLRGLFQFPEQQTPLRGGATQTIPQR
ncbi:MAG: AsmA-like C-terminal domain-containing protein [Pseudomonadota bacterium]